MALWTIHNQMVITFAADAEFVNKFIVFVEQYLVLDVGVRFHIYELVLYFIQKILATDLYKMCKS